MSGLTPVLSLLRCLHVYCRLFSHIKMTHRSVWHFCVNKRFIFWNVFAYSNRLLSLCFNMVILLPISDSYFVMPWPVAAFVHIIYIIENMGKVYVLQNSVPWCRPLYWSDEARENCSATGSLLDYHTRPIVSRGCGLCLWIAHNPFMHCGMSQYVFKPRDVKLLNNRISVAKITYATSSPCCVLLNGMFHQDSATQRNK